MTWTFLLGWVSGFAIGWLVLWYWMVKPMARLLGFEKDGDPLPPTAEEPPPSLAGPFLGGRGTTT